MKAVIFDVDGTLWDSSESVLKAWNGVFAKRGLPLRTLTDIHACIGLTREKIEEKFCQRNWQQSGEPVNSPGKEPVRVPGIPFGKGGESCCQLIEQEGKREQQQKPDAP